jgi:hypothetical protein
MSNRWPGGLIRKTPVTPAGPFQNGAATGVWTLAEASFWTKQGLWPIAGNLAPVVEDAFSTWLYTGNGSTQTITNGINLSGQGGMVWIKARSSAQSNIVFDTNRGVENRLVTNANIAQSTLSGSLTAFNSNGFALGNFASTNDSGVTYASWTFRQEPKFFDVVTYTGDGANRTIAHNLGVAPGMILVKRTDTTGDWQVYHRSNANTQYMVLNDTAAVATGATRWNSTTPTATEFSVGTDATVNASGGTYVAYLFAHNTASDGFIQCGSYNNSGGLATVTLGWEPQWILMKNAAAAGDWFMVDNMRGLVVGGSDPYLYANSAASENSGDIVTPTATGFVTAGLPGSTNFIYMAIRRGPMRTPTLGTSVFSPVAYSGTGSGATQLISTSFPVDAYINRRRASTNSNFAGTRLTSSSTYLTTNTSDSATNLGGGNGTNNSIGFASNVGLGVAGDWNDTSVAYIDWAFRRAPGFMDVVCYTGNGVAGRTVNHNLGVAPEMMIVKGRDNAGTNWLVYAAPLGPTQSLFLNLDYQTGTYPYWNSTTPTATAFTVGSSYDANTSGGTYVAYLFASVPGVSKVGSYTGNGSSQTINCAFTTGARFVLIKRTDSTGDWYVWDSARGIVAGNDPYLALNTTAAEVTTNDSVDTDNTGFIVNQVAASNINVNAATYIFLAIA